MRLERVGGNQIKLFLTYDELIQLGLSKEDIEIDSIKWHQLFFEVINEAKSEFNLYFDGTILIDIYTLHSQGMMILITLHEDLDEFFGDDLEGLFFTHDQGSKKVDLCYSFTEIESVIQFAKAIATFEGDSTLLYYNHLYYLYIPEILEHDSDKFDCLLAEYGNPSNVTLAVIQEYGKPIIRENAVSFINQTFHI